MESPQFRLQDQFGAWHEIAFPRARIVVLALADRKGSDQLEGWLLPLAERYGDVLDIHGVARLSGVPSGLRPMIRALFRRSMEHPVMMDWTGGVSSAFDYVGEKANLVVLTPRGKVEYRFNGEASPEELARCFAAIDRILEQLALREG